MASIAAAIRNKLNRNLANVESLSDSQQSAFRTAIGASDFSGDYNDLMNIPADMAFATSEVRASSALAVSALNQWVDVGADVPAATASQWFLILFDGKLPWLPVYLPPIRALTDGTAGGTTATAQRIELQAPDVLNTIYLGIASDESLLFASLEGDGDNAAYSPTSLEIRQIDI